MPRKRRKCRVEFLPPATYYKPAGIPLRELDEIALSVEEFEALRLKDLDRLEQVQCAERMGIARTTFQRILYSARSKIAEAFVKGNALRIEGGEYVMSSERLFKCTCGSRFTASRYGEQEERELCCPGCGKKPVQGIHSHRRHSFGRQPAVKGSCRQQDSSVSTEDKEKPDDSQQNEDQ
ncbi:MAG: DUF134 domain-containing protein [Syntrophaceticus sp.]|jgi:predicted DNA-binding protein (UPF0251 family)|nr:DUF134 domain-containing protein [Syntrophaceticus sp.]MDD3314379.1 DUF134 domain-containing protein [Syntrophaceticus sp.]MDD4360047.1 DUF134 domain-containing protein [Syntrophaceticus sp.]MDD4783127.1 DUF134 domain-containing protein [Syntrophaceticus sp.]